MRHGPHRFVCTILPFITEIGKENIQLQTIRMTATLHQAYKYLKVKLSFIFNRNFLLWCYAFLQFHRFINKKN